MDLEAGGCLAERVLKRGMVDRNLGLYTLELYILLWWYADLARAATQRTFHRSFTLVWPDH